jgi:hypothetical protein
MRKLRKAIFLAPELWERIARIARRNKRTIIAQLDYWSEQDAVEEKTGKALGLPRRELKDTIKVKGFE